MTKEETIARLLELERILKPEGYKELYAERDALTVALAVSGFTEETTEEHTLLLRDNFADDKNCAWTAAAVRRYEIIIKPRKKSATKNDSD